MTLTPGATLGPYTITAELGHGGMGVVYMAHNPRLDRQVAIKVLPPDLTRDETAKQRFLQEAMAASALDHPNICTIYEINETEDGQLYLVMAYYAGEPLKRRPLRVTHVRYYWLLLAEGHLTRRLFGDMLRRIWALPGPAD